MNVKYLNSILINRRIPLDAVIKEPLFLLLSVTPIYEYRDGRKTDTITGYSYECVDTMDFNRFKVKIEDQKAPVISNEELRNVRENGKRVAVEFSNATILAYLNESRGSIEDTIKADDILLVNSVE